LNIGAGRVVDQWLVRINKGLATQDVATLPPLRKFLSANQNAPRLHLCGLYSDGGVHSHLAHVECLLDLVEDNFDGEIFLHLFTDGRDTPPESGLGFIQALEDSLTSRKAQIASIQGRFYVMDRDKRWERTQRAYDCLTKGAENLASKASAWLKASYDHDITDEFIEPATITPDSTMAKGDAVIFWNFRADRMRQIVRALCLEESDVEREQVVFAPEQTLCFTRYDESFPLPILFEPLEITNYLGKVIEQAGLTQLRVAETEKYPHVTYFLNGGNEQECEGEHRSLIPSPRDVKTYDQKPEMSAMEVKQVVLNAIQQSSYDAIIVNFANCDMVGHTGSLPAAIKAVETVDRCLGEILVELEQRNGQMLVIADHGNAEMMLDKTTGEPHTAHTTFPVPIILVGHNDAQLRSGCLCDVAPTLLELMELAQPNEMTGRSLLNH
ncbi:MAG: 2,3-bisphosphoglycerate-independent phosphoglycerate mutase, partial [Bdellovibrionales bacterium]|nr:2,3-bisphosphoglycerate-independent phosphoglycerate mutase [Bdellovibrionales bacterium]